MQPTLSGLSSFFKEQVSGFLALKYGLTISLSQPKTLPLLLSLIQLKTFFFLTNKKKKDELIPDLGDHC